VIRPWVTASRSCSSPLAPCWPQGHRRRRRPRYRLAGRPDRPAAARSRDRRRPASRMAVIRPRLAHPQSGARPAPAGRHRVHAAQAGRRGPRPRCQPCHEVAGRPLPRGSPSTPLSQPSYPSRNRGQIPNEIDIATLPGCGRQASRIGLREADAWPSPAGCAQAMTRPLRHCPARSRT
jgi:hypothetical protein